MKQTKLEIFEKLHSEILKYFPFLLSQTPILLSSGGKDSNLILEFYEFLYETKKISLPHIFHMNHQIRSNPDQEMEINEALSTTKHLFPYHVKKKAFPDLPNGFEGI